LSRGPSYGCRGKVLLAFENNGSSKIGVRFENINCGKFSTLNFLKKRKIFKTQIVHRFFKMTKNFELNSILKYQMNFFEKVILY